MIKPWEKLSSKPVGDFRIFTIRSDRKKSPRTQQAHDFFVIDSVNWVNVIAVTPEQAAVAIADERLAREGAGRRWRPGDPAAWTNGAPLERLRP